MIFEVSGVHMGRYGLILCANESYTNNLAIGINFEEKKAPAGTPKGDPGFLRKKSPLRARQNKLMACIFKNVNILKIKSPKCQYVEN